MRAIVSETGFLTRGKNAGSKKADMTLATI